MHSLWTAPWTTACSRRRERWTTVDSVGDIASRRASGLWEAVDDARR